MAVYHQMGHHSENLLTESFLTAFRGAILSPVNYDQTGIQTQITTCRGLPNFRSIFDPQLYFPHTERECLRQWSYFPNDVDTADTSSEAWWTSLLDNLVQVCQILNPDAICSPAIVPRSYSDDYYDIMVRVGSQLCTRLDGSHIDTIQTAVVGLSDIGATNRAYAIASILSRTRAREIFLVLVSNIEPRRELSDPEELKGAMRIIKSLEESGLRVIVGFASSEIVLWKQAGATSCASGKFFNLRRFTSSRFEEPSVGGGQLPYWTEESLLAFLRESDLLRIRNAGLVSQASQANPYGNQIITSLDTSPGTAWLRMAWRQYLYWFADIEQRISDQQVNVSQMLRQAEQNWTNIEDLNILMEERRNDGQWLRSWRRALAEYQQ